MSNTLIIGGGDFPSNIDLKDLFESFDNIIAADRGYELLYRCNIKPDFLLGDFDSIETNLKIDSSVEIIEYPSEKSMTDMEIAIDKAVEIKSKYVVILGATGSRLDHTFINMLLLKKLFDNNILGKIIDDNNEVTIIKNHAKVAKNKFKYLSIIPLFDNTIISLEGVKYPLDNQKVKYGSSLCISNEIISDFANIKTSNYCIIFMSKD